MTSVPMLRLSFFLFKCVHPYFTEYFYNNYFKVFVRWFQHLCHHCIVIC